ncbi:unnamed protein product [Amaranthus hypochondriacus]
MEAQRRSSLRSKRKPLSDCTNTLSDFCKKPSSNIPKSQTLIKPSKSSNFTSNSVKNNFIPHISSSPRSPTSTGSNSIPNFKNVSSIPQSYEPPPPPPTPVFGAGGMDIRKSRFPCVQSREKETARKDKGIMIADTPITELSASLTSKPGHSFQSGIQAVESPNVHVQILEDKGKSLLDASVIKIPSSLTPKYKMSSSTFDGSLSETSAAHSQKKLHEEKVKDKGKTVLENPDIEPSKFFTAHASRVLVAASGTGERPLAVYNQSRGHPGRKRTAGKTNLSMGHPSYDKRMKKGFEFDYEGGLIQPESHPDPLPRRKKKQSRKKHDGSVHLLPQEMVEKLQSYYAGIDAFELQEEEVSENELEGIRLKR